MRGTWGLGLALAMALAQQLPAMGTLGLPASELALRYPWEAGPEGTRLYRLGQTNFSPIVSDGRVVGAIAELPPGASDADLVILLAAITEGLRQEPAVTRGSLESNTWERKTPDYMALARREGEAIVVLIQETLPSPTQKQPPAPTPTIADPVYRAQNDLEILKMAMEAYRARHFFRYPEASNVDALIQMLQRSEILPDGFQLQAPVTQFGAWRTGYHITVRAGSKTVTIRQPERWDPFWSYWQIRPFP